MSIETIIKPADRTMSVDQITETEWSKWLPRFADASVYQSWSYGSVCWGKNQLSHLVLKENGTVLAMAQVRIVRLPVLGKGIAYVRWGPLCRLAGELSARDEVIQATLQALKEEYVERRGLMLRLIPNVYAKDVDAESWRVHLAAQGYRPDPEVQIYHTICVDLTGSLEAIRKRLNQKWRNQLNGAERNGLTVREGTDELLFSEFTAIYRELLDRKQFETSVDIDEFARIQRGLPANLKMQVLLCEKDGKVMAGLVAADVGDTGIYLLGATSSEGLKVKGSYLLQWRMIQRLHEKGCRWYDLGGINPDRNPGVYHFKSGFGGQETCQLGGYTINGDWLNSAMVSCGERLRTMLQPLRARVRG